VRRKWWAVLPSLALLLAGCGVQPSGVTDAGEAPTGLAPGATLYFVDSHLRLRPQVRGTQHLGSISEALSLLMYSPHDPDLHTEIQDVGTTQVLVATFPGLIELRVPLTTEDVSPLGIDQLVCTALGVFIQNGGDKSTKVRIQFVQTTPESDEQRSCPLFGTVSPGR
jgi:hypothetical protein